MTLRTPLVEGLRMTGVLSIVQQRFWLTLFGAAKFNGCKFKYIPHVTNRLNPE